MEGRLLSNCKCAALKLLEGASGAKSAMYDVTLPTKTTKSQLGEEYLHLVYFKFKTDADELRIFILGLPVRSEGSRLPVISHRGYVGETQSLGFDH